MPIDLFYIIIYTSIHNNFKVENKIIMHNEPLKQEVVAIFISIA